MSFPSFRSKQGLRHVASVSAVAVFVLLAFGSGAGGGRESGTWQQEKPQPGVDLCMLLVSGDTFACAVGVGDMTVQHSGTITERKESEDRITLVAKGKAEFAGQTTAQDFPVEIVVHKERSEESDWIQYSYDTGKGRVSYGHLTRRKK